MSPAHVIRPAILACLAAFALAAPASAADRLVAPDGADAGTCLSSACASLGYVYGKADAGDTVRIAPGSYPSQVVPAGAKAVTFTGQSGATLQHLDNWADNVTFDHVDLDGHFTTHNVFENHGADGVTYRHSSIGNVTDEKGALVAGDDFTFDDMVFHDAILVTAGTHMECLYAIGVPRMTIRRSRFTNCGIMDLFFTYGDWWDPLPPAYGGVTLENNVFEHPRMENGQGFHFYSLLVGATGPGGGTMDGWTVRNNTFEAEANIGVRSGTNGTRWVANAGGWNCAPGVRFHHNVGEVCDPLTDTPVTPQASSSAIIAPYGWADPLQRDFHLTLGSPAIDGGDPADSTATDTDGTPRDAFPDAGAYEYAGPATAPKVTGGPVGASADPSPVFTFTSDARNAQFQCRLDGPAGPGAWTACAAPYQQPGLPDGAYLLRVRVRHTPAGVEGLRAFTIDTAAPDAPVIERPADGMLVSALVISGHAEPGSTVDVHEGGATLARTLAGPDGSWSAKAADASDGLHTYTATAIDAAGNESADSSSRSARVDRTPPPAPLIDQPADSAWSTTGAVTISGRAEPGATVALREGATARGSAHAGTDGRWSADLELPEGDHALVATAADAAGNVSSPSAARTVRVDKTAPRTSFSASAAGAFTSDEPGSTFECRLDGPGASIGTWLPCTSPKTYDGLADGTYVFHVRAVDQAGNVDLAGVSRTFTLDSHAPDAPVLSAPADGAWSRDHSVTVRGTGEPLGTITVLDGNDAAATTTVDELGSWSLTLADRAEGLHRLSAIATDIAGNRSPASTPHTVTVDTVAPHATIASGPDGVTRDPSPSFALTADESGATFACRLDAGAAAGDWASCAATKTYTSLADGDYVLRVRAIDAARNEETAGATRAFRVDAHAPAAPELTTPAAGAITRDAAVAVTGKAEPGATVALRDGAAAKASVTTDEHGAWSLTLPGLDDGEHVLTATATDAAGNTSPASGPTTVTVDTHAPATPAVTSPAEGGWQRTHDVDLHGTSEAGAVIDVAESGAARGSAVAGPDGRWSVTVAGLADGAHALTFTASDAAGNHSAAATRTVRVDTVAPHTTITDGPGEVVTSTSVTFSFTADEPGSTFSCALDGAWATCTSPLTLSPVSAGAHTFSIRATDPSGTTDAGVATRTFTVAPTAVGDGETPPQQQPRGAAPQPDPPSSGAPAPPVVIATATAGGGAPLDAVLPSWTAALERTKVTTLVQRGLDLRFAAPGAGTLTAQLFTALASGAAARTAARVLVAKGTRAFPAAGPGTVRLAVTKAGRRLLQRAKKPALLLDVRFAPATGPASRATRPVVAGLRAR